MPLGLFSFKSKPKNPEINALSISLKSAPKVNLSKIANSASSMLKTMKSNEDNKKQVAYSKVLSDINTLFDRPIDNININYEDFTKDRCDQFLKDDNFKDSVIHMVCGTLYDLKGQYEAYDNKLKDYLSILKTNEMVDTHAKYKGEIKRRIYIINKSIAEVKNKLTTHCDKIINPPGSSRLDPELKRRLNALKGITQPPGSSGGKRTRKHKRKTVRHKKTLRRR